jgi:hypothetical protein
MRTGKSDVLELEFAVDDLGRVHWLEEAAQIDAASIYRSYFRIVLPLLKPAIATMDPLGGCHLERLSAREPSCQQQLPEDLKCALSAAFFHYIEQLQHGNGEGDDLGPSYFDSFRGIGEIFHQGTRRGSREGLMTSGPRGSSRHDA